jgi:8-oxo-dGTP pyrophosphatase MutT (NUDIX family)
MKAIEACSPGFQFENLPEEAGTVARSYSKSGFMSTHLIPLPQSGALAYRFSSEGKLEILLVKKLHASNWGIPKGKLEASLSREENAAKEAFEEAGVKGVMQQRCLGSYRAMKRSGDRDVLIEVWVYLLQVTEVADEWPEKAVRVVRWCDPDEAALLLREPLLAELCHKLKATEHSPGSTLS